MNENTQATILQPAFGSVQALMEKYSTDSTFRAEFDAANTREDAVRVAARQGIAVSLEDITALAEVSDELSDDVLDRVSGGEISGGLRAPEFNYTFN